MMKVLIGLFLLTGLFAGENLNGIYLGEDVGAIDGAHKTAIQITEDGTVIVYLGASVPGLHDRNGNAVKILRVRTIRQ